MLSAHIPHLNYIWLLTASTIAGVMNAMAGGGSFLSFPAMLGVGVAPVQANSTNTVALWPGQLVSLATLRGDLRRDLAWTVAVVSLIGGVGGAEVLLHTSQVTFLRLIPWLILVGTAVFAVSGPLSRWMRSRAEHPHLEPKIPRVWLAISLLPVTFYIGYFGAGGGFLTMTILALHGMDDMHELNALKVVSQMVSNFCAIVTFVITGNVEWRFCLISMVFAAFGGWMGAKFTKRVSGAALRAFVVATGCVIAAWFFWRH